MELVKYSVNQDGLHKFDQVAVHGQLQLSVANFKIGKTFRFVNAGASEKVQDSQPAHIHAYGAIRPDRCTVL